MATDLIVLRQRLSEAETALHRLMTGSSEERIARGGVDVTFTKTSISALERYINNLKNQIAIASGNAPRRTMIQTYF